MDSHDETAAAQPVGRSLRVSGWREDEAEDENIFLKAKGVDGRGGGKGGKGRGELMVENLFHPSSKVPCPVIH